MEMTMTTGLAVLTAGIDALRSETGNKELQAQTVLCFCQIAMRRELPMFDLIKLLDVSNASVSRNVYTLGTELGLVEAFEDPEFRRRKIVRLTTKGNTVAAKVVKAMNGKLFFKEVKNA